jgi:hypothetical protein
MQTYQPLRYEPCDRSKEVHTLIKRSHIIGLGAMLALALLTVAGSATSEASHLTTTSAELMAVDTNTTGNTPNGLGTLDSCVEVAAGGSTTLDITIQNIPASQELAMTAFAFNLRYDPTAISVTAADNVQLLTVAPGSSNPPITAGDEVLLPDIDGQFMAASADVGPLGSEESGSGVLERLTVNVGAGAAAGGYALNIFDAATVDILNNTHQPQDTASALIAVGVTCASLPAPEPPPAIMGDVNCSGGVNAVDALGVLRNNSALPVVQNEPCNDIGALTPHVGDVDCSGLVNAVDALKILRSNAALSVAQTEPCDDIGT